jgi:uncharacterized protein YprB with RNaseH-like and TPR domain
MDRALMLVVMDNQDKTWPERADILTRVVGVPITEDMIRNRHRRVVNDMDRGNVIPFPESAVVVPHNPAGQYVGFDMAYFDIETQSLSAWNGTMTVVSIADQFGRLTTRDRFEFPQESILDDKGLAVWARDELEKYDILVAWYGSQFDLGYINAKLIEHSERPLRDMLFIDPIYKARGGRYGLKVGSSKLKNVAIWLNTDHQKPELAPSVWLRANIGEAEAVETLRDRCESDCLVMRDIFQHLKPMIRTIHR